VVFPVDGWPPMVAEWQLGRRWGSMLEVEVLEDGSIKLKEKKSAPVKAEVDGDPDELAEDPSEALAKAPARWMSTGPAAGGFVPLPSAPSITQPVAPVMPFPASSVPRNVIISMDHMPSGDQFQAFTASYGKGTGVNNVLLCTPQGQLPFSASAADPGWAAQISLVLGGARVSYFEAEQAQHEMASGLAL